MDFKIKKGSPEKIKTDALILAVFDGNTLGTGASSLAPATRKAWFWNPELKTEIFRSIES